MAVASVFSQMRSIGVPLGMADPVQPNPVQPNISATLWRTVAEGRPALLFRIDDQARRILGRSGQSGSEAGGGREDTQDARSQKSRRRSLFRIQARRAVQVHDGLTLHFDRASSAG